MSGKPVHSIDVRRGVIAAYVGNEKISVIAARYGVSRSYPVVLAKSLGLKPRGAKHPPGKPRKAHA